MESSIWGNIYTKHKIDANGIDISNTSNNSKFIASNEKVGVYKAEEIIFDVNNETTTVKNLIVRDVEGSIVQVGKIREIVRTNGVDYIYVD